MKASGYFKLLLILLGCFLNLAKCILDGDLNERVIYAVNVGGQEHQNVDGIKYMEDPINNKELSSALRFQNTIRRIDPPDQILFQTYRSSSIGFTYKIPIEHDGSYVLVLQFCELSPYQIGKRSFHVLLDESRILSDFGIYFRVGFSTAHQELIPFTVSDERTILEVKGQVSDIDENTVSLRFKQGRTPPIINAFYIIEGSVEDIPKLPELTLSPVNQEETRSATDIIYAVNAGGEEHVDVHGIQYEKDPCRDGIDSDYGLKLDIRRIPRADAYLYQTERYGTESFGYDIPIEVDGPYVLVLKFAEVWFRNPQAKVFDVVLNHVHVVLHQLDIFAEVGYGTGHDEIIAFEVMDGGETLVVEGKTSVISNGRIHLEFVKGPLDNPKINAFYVLKGTVNDVPVIPSTPISGRDDREYSDEDFYSEFGGYSTPVTEEEKPQRTKRILQNSKIKPSGPVSQDPWEKESAFNTFYPVLLALVICVASSAWACRKLGYIKW